MLWSTNANAPFYSKIQDFSQAKDIESLSFSVAAGAIMCYK